MPSVTCEKCGHEVEYTESIGPWILTYGDMVTNMLTFFIALLTFAVFDIRKFHLVLSSFRNAIGVFDAGKTINLTQEELVNAGNTFQRLAKEKKIPRPRKDISKAFGWLENKLGDAVRARVEERGVVIQLTNRLLFKPASTELTVEARELLRNIAFFLKEIVPGNPVRVEGYSDDIPLAGLAKQRFGSNLKLSVLRAISVFDELVRRDVDPTRMSAAGYGPYRLLEMKEGETLDEWRERNRRVDIVIVRKDWSD